MKRIYYIKQGSGGDFNSISAALAAITAADKLQQSDQALPPVTLMIYNGIYKEQITITRPYLTLIGQSPEHTILTYDLYARMPMPDIGKLGTFRSYSVMIDTHDVTVSNLTFENSSGSGVTAGQAIALYADGDRLSFDRCRFLGGQDTLFTAPLPEKELEPHGFFGPKQTAPRNTGRHYYRDCYFTGDIDFIFGGATAFFERCEFFSQDTGQPVSSYVTAASTPHMQRYGYVMENCRFTGDGPSHSAYLGRPWREHAKTVLLGCYIGRHICAEGWHDWDKPAAHATVFYAEYGNYGPSSDITKRPDWVKELSPAEAAAYTRNLVLSGPDHWDPLFKELMSVVLE